LPWAKGPAAVAVELLFRLQALLLMPPARALLGLAVDGRAPECGERGMIVAANHSSWIDAWVLQAAIWPQRITFLMTELYYDLPVAGLYFRAVGARPIREEGPSVAGLRAAREALEAGEIVCLFPEGEITWTGEMGKGRRGVARLARRTGATVLPVGIHGAMHVWSRVQRRPRPHRVTLAIGAPMRYDESDDRGGEQRFTERLMNEIRGLCER